MMKIPFGDLKFVYREEEDAINEAVTRVLKSGWYILGEELRNFEQQFADYLSVKYVVGCNSGTDAIQLALRSCGLGLGDEVITVANTCVPTVTGIRLAGAIPVFVDINADNLMMDHSKVEAAITEKTRAILTVNLYGGGPDYAQIQALAGKHHLPLIEDNAQGIGATYKGIQLGTLGDIGCFSFYPSKNLGAFGDAGAIVTNNSDLYEKAVMIRNYGQTTRYIHEMEGINSRLDEVQSAILSVLLRGIDCRNDRRREIGRRYLYNIRNKDVLLPVFADDIHPNFHLFVIRVTNREHFQEYLSSQDIQTLIHYPVPVHKQPFYLASHPQTKLPVTEQVAEMIVSLPCYYGLTDEEVGYIIDCVNSYRCPN